MEVKDLIYELTVACQGYYWVETPGVSLSLNPFQVHPYCYKQVFIPGSLIERIKLGWEVYQNGRQLKQIKSWSNEEV